MLEYAFYKLLSACDIYVLFHSNENLYLQILLVQKNILADSNWTFASFALPFQSTHPKTRKLLLIIRKIH